MFLKYFDILSDSLTLHYENFHSHKSIISSILSIIVYIICLAYGIFLLLDITNHLNPTSFCYVRQETDIGVFPINETSLFHFFSFPNFPETETLENIIEIFGFMNFDFSIEKYNNETSSRLNFSHYTYNKCPLDSKKYKLNHIKDLIKDYSLNESFCLSGYYNKTSDTYIKITDENFPYPVNEKGTSNLNYTSYQIIIQSCENDTFSNFNSCKSKNYIKSIMNSSIDTILTMMNQEVDVNNYKEPIINKFLHIRFTLTPNSNTFSVSNLNFQPLRVKTYNNIIFSNIYKEDYSYYYEQNDIKNYINNCSIYTSYQFWMQNKVFIYERNYKKIQNLMIDLGGLVKTITSIAKIINYVFCRYQTFIDIDKILLKRISLNIENHEKKNINLKKFKNDDNSSPNESNKIFVKKYSYNINSLIKVSQRKKNIQINDKKNHNFFSFIKENKFLSKKIGILSTNIHLLINSKNKKGKYINIVKWYYQQIVSEQNLFDLYFFCSSLENNEKTIFQSYKYDRLNLLKSI